MTSLATCVRSKLNVRPETFKSIHAIRETNRSFVCVVLRGRGPFKLYRAKNKARNWTFEQSVTTMATKTPMRALTITITSEDHECRIFAAESITTPVPESRKQNTFSRWAGSPSLLVQIASKQRNTTNNCNYRKEYNYINYPYEYSRAAAGATGWLVQFLGTC